MRKITYDQIIEKAKGNLEYAANVPDFQDPDLINYVQELTISHTKAIVDSINENIEIHNNKNFICNKCDEYLAHTGEQESCDPPIDIYKCSDCGKIVEVKQKSTLMKEG